MSLLVVGSMAFDEIETPFGKSGRIIGGAGLYIALSAAYHTRPVNLVSVIGEDFPEQTLETLRQRGIDIAGVERKTGRKTFYWKGRYHIDLNTRDSLVTELNVLGDFNPRLPDHFRNPDYVMLGNLSPQVQLSVIDQLPQRPRLVALDTMNFWIESTPEDLRKVIGKVDIIIINDEEARMLGQTPSLVKAAQRILHMGPEYVIIKKGEHGALLFSENEVFVAPGLPIEEVFDPTGAGDSFAGGLMGHVARTNDTSFDNLKRAVIVGSAMASFCIEKFGPQRLLELSPEAILRRQEVFKQLSHFDILYH